MKVQYLGVLLMNDWKMVALVMQASHQPVAVRTELNSKVKLFAYLLIYVPALTEGPEIWAASRSQVLEIG